MPLQKNTDCADPNRLPHLHDSFCYFSIFKICFLRFPIFSFIVIRGSLSREVSAPLFCFYTLLYFWSKLFSWLQNILSWLAPLQPFIVSTSTHQNHDCWPPQMRLKGPLFGISENQNSRFSCFNSSPKLFYFCFLLGLVIKNSI